MLSADDEVVALREKFQADTADTVWTAALGREGGWAVVTRDAAMRRNPQEREALRQATLTTFCLARGWAKEGLWGIAWRLVRWWPDITKQATLLQPGLWYSVPMQHGKLHVWND